LIVTSPSGAGKTTLVRRLLAAAARAGAQRDGTPPARRVAGEEDGRDYHFVDRARFDAMIARGAFAEWAEVHGQRYGTSLEKVAEVRPRAPTAGWCS
jgi:guanylate kinase